MEVKMPELLELMRRTFDHGVKCRDGATTEERIDSMKEDMIISFLVCIQENDNCFCIAPEIGNPFLE